MPKPRADLQVVAYRLDKAIYEGRAQALPIYPAPTNGLGRRPTLLILFKSVRLRLPPVRFDDPRKYKSRTERLWENRVTIRPSILNSRWVTVGESAPDYQWLTEHTPEERETRGVITIRGKMRRRIYEVVADLSHGLRQCIHVKEEYHTEIEALERERLALTDQLARDRARLSIISNKRRRELNLGWTTVSQRLADIGSIYQDRTSREARLSNFVRMSTVQLFFLANSLSTFSASIRRGRYPNYPAMEIYLRGLELELNLYSSQEIRGYRQSAQRKIRKAIADFGVKDLETIGLTLDQAASLLSLSAQVLSKWAETLYKEEDPTEL